MDHSSELNANMNRQYDQFMNVLFNDKSAFSTSIASDASSNIDFDEISTNFLQKPTSTPTWKTIGRYEKPASTNFDSNHFGSSSILAIPYSPLQPTDISSVWSDHKNSLNKSLEPTLQSFNQLQNFGPIGPSQTAVLPRSRSDCLVPVEQLVETVPFQNIPQRLIDANFPMSWMMHERESVSFDHYKDLNKRMLGYQTYPEPDRAYEKSRAAMVLHDEKSESDAYFREKKGKGIPIVGRLKANSSQVPAKSCSMYSLDDATDYDDTELDPSINAGAIGLYPPKIRDWDRIVAKMQLCVLHLTHLRNRRQFGIEKPPYTLEISNPYPKLNYHWHCIDKIIHTEYKSSFLFVRKLQLRCQLEEIKMFTDIKVVFQQFDEAATAFEKTRDISILQVFAHGVMINQNEIAKLIAAIDHLTSSVRATSNLTYALQMLLELHEKKQQYELLAEPLIPELIAPSPPTENLPKIQKTRRMGF